MKNFKINIILGLFLMLGLTSCYEESNWLADNAELSGDQFPIIQSTSLENTEYKVGETLVLTVHYWSADEIKELQLFESIDGSDESLYSTSAYVSNYDEETRTDVMEIPYEVPGGTVGKAITLRVVVVNENGLTSKEEAITQNYGYDLSTFTVVE